MRWSILNKLSICPALRSAAFESFMDKGIDFTNNMIMTGVTSYLNHQSSKSLMNQMLDKQHEWSESMYNKYQSPQALMEQYRAAGINPLLQQGELGKGSLPISSGASAPSSTSPLGSNGSPLGTPEYLAAAASSQRSQAVMSMIQAVNEAIIKQGPIVGKRMLDKVLPQFAALGYDESWAVQLFAPQLMESQANANLKKIESDWMSEHGNELFSERLANLQAQTSEAFSRIDVQSSEVEKNQALTKQYYQDIKESFSRIARNYAEALELNKVGDKYEADAKTADMIRQAVVNQAYLTNVGIALSNEGNRVDLGIKEAGAAIKRKQASDPVLQGVKFGLETLGNIIHVNGGFNWSNLYVPPVGK